MGNDRYEIVGSGELEGLENLVNASISEGRFIPQGAPFWSKKDGMYLQALFMPKDAPAEKTDRDSEPPGFGVVSGAQHEGPGYWHFQVVSAASDTEAARLKKDLAERDRAITERDAVISERNEAIEELDDQLSGLKAQLRSAEAQDGGRRALLRDTAKRMDYAISEIKHGRASVAEQLLTDFLEDNLSGYRP